ncbi:hypothetical protein [Actinomadura litoris]|uniref:Uncharacterized protein n=1 Tax=Actinomadura litoris TaxID=2678616 RepID=A0A7K1LAK5_9ACTN|nr:hypothetical protein [Actinomadura litoris]MUN41467.1 hypothetical protein [Actinomadura litoris]
MSVSHLVSTGHLPEVRAVSWSCCCGASEVRHYGRTVTAVWAVRLMQVRADRHRITAAHHPTTRK